MQFLKFVKENIWIVKVVVTIAVVIFAHTFIRFFINFLKKKSILKRYDWKKRIDYVLLKPLILIIWVLGVVYVVDVIANQFGFKWFLDYLVPVRDGTIVVFFAWLLFRWKNVFHHSILASPKRKIDAATLHLISKLASVVITFIALLVVLQVMGLNITPLVAFGGVGAAALGFAAKDVISNFFGGLMIYITRPFTKGDFVEIPKEGVLGTIENIGWYLTCIRDLDQCPIYIPNSLFSTAQMKNKSRRNNRKIEEVIGVRYSDFSKIREIVGDIKRLFEGDERIDNGIESIVSFITFGPYSLDIKIRTYTVLMSYFDYMEAKADILFKIKEIIKKHGADIPFPTTTVNLEK